MGVKVPDDRSLNQRVRAFCANPLCAEDGAQFQFDVDHDHFKCPKCGANRSPMVGMLVLTHLLCESPKGEVRGSGGLRFELACDSERAVLATATNQEAATDNPKIANCPDCLKRAEKEGRLKPVGAKLVYSFKKSKAAQAEKE